MHDTSIPPDADQLSIRTGNLKVSDKDLIPESSNVDGEALQIGEGQTDFEAVMAELADVEAAVIPEIWLGHRNDGEAFLVALQRLAEALGTSQ